MTERTLRSSEERLQDIRTRAESLGIDEAYISTLVDTFYTRIQEHAALGPIFERRVDGRWPEHLATMKKFWRSVALGTGEYEGRPVPAHMTVGIADESLFADWLGLFKQTLTDTAPCPEAETFFLDRATNIAQSLKYAIFGLPDLKSAEAAPASS